MGPATLSGHAYGPVDAASAFALAANTPGVKNVVNEVRVDPLSPMDDRSRIELFRSHLRISYAQQIRNGPGKAHPHLGAKRQRDTLRRGQQARWTGLLLVYAPIPYQGYLK